MTGRDGEARAATVKTHSKDDKLIRLNKPLQKLYPLEVLEPAPTPQSPQPELFRQAATLTETTDIASEPRE